MTKETNDKSTNAKKDKSENDDLYYAELEKIIRKSKDYNKALKKVLKNLTEESNKE